VYYILLSVSRPVVIRSSGGDAENRSIINDFIANGTDSILTLTCTSVHQNEIVEWIMLNISGNVEQKYSDNSYSSTITFINPSDDFASLLRCKSNDTLLYKDVDIIKRKCLLALNVITMCICIKSTHICIYVHM